MTERVAQATDTWTYTITEAREHDRIWETASNYTRYVLLPGTYPVRFTNLDWTEWNPDPAVVTPGFTANIGPYYAVIEVDATKEHSYWVDRVFQYESAHTEDHRHERVTFKLDWYAFQVTESATPDGFHRA